MRARSHNSRVLLGQRPFEGSLGASLYVGTPDPADIRYRRGKCVGPNALWYPISETATIDPGAAEVQKCLAVGQCTSPTEEINYTLPAALLGQTISCQIRTFASDYENETIYRPVTVVDDGTGEKEDAILGTATILSIEKRDDGGMLLRFAYEASRDGIQPLQFAIVQTGGPGSLSDEVVTASGRIHTIEISGLTDGEVYEWQLEARNGVTSAVLVIDIAFTADAEGPPAVTNLEAIEI